MTPTTPVAPASPVAMLGRGVVRHRRLKPTEHAFAYSTYFLLLPLRQLRTRSLPALNRNGWGLLAFHDRDHGDGRADALAWIEELLHAEGVNDAGGEVWLHTYPRVLGHVFKPVSFWYCHRSDDSLAAIVVEVNNTFGERHCYLLAGPGLAWGRELSARKVFHVSPFCDVQGQYRFRFMRSAARIVARVDHDDDTGPLLQTSVSGRLQPLTTGTARRTFCATPLMTWGVIARIHWQAVKLWFKGVPMLSKPDLPRAFTTR